MFANIRVTNVTSPVMIDACGVGQQKTKTSGPRSLLTVDATLMLMHIAKKQEKHGGVNVMDVKTSVPQSAIGVGHGMMMISGNLVRPLLGASLMISDKLDITTYMLTKKTAKSIVLKRLN